MNKVMYLRAALVEGNYVLDEDPLASQDYICSLKVVKIRFIENTDVYRCVQMKNKHIDFPKCV